MRKLLFLICVLGMPCASWAQSNQASWENLNMLQAGEKIQVVEMNSKNVSGTFLNVSDAAISLQEKADQQTIQRQDVQSVKLRKHQNRSRNTLIAAAVGAGVGAGISAATFHPCRLPLCFDFGRGGAAAAGALSGLVVGLVGGAVVGVLVPSHKTIYLVKAH